MPRRKLHVASGNPLVRPVDWQWSGVPSNGSWQMAQHPTLRTCVLVRGEHPGILDLGAIDFPMLTKPDFAAIESDDRPREP
jgi:hypothetical protein